MRSIIENEIQLDAVRERTGGRSAKVREAVLKAARIILMERGAEALTHRNVAQLASVNASTVYRRWPDRALLIADVFQSTADSLVRLPDTGNLRDDLLHFLQNISDMLVSPEGRKFAQGGISSISSGDEMVSSVIRSLWEQRFKQAEIMFEKAAARGENGYKGQRRSILETLIAPVWFRIMVTQGTVDDDYLIENIRRLLTE